MRSNPSLPRSLRGPRAVRSLACALLAGAALAGAGCRQDMHDQPRLKPLRESSFFADGSGARPLPAHVVSRGNLRADVVFYTGKWPDGQFATALPRETPLSRELLLRGRERYDIFCSPCHDASGSGRGMVVRRGFKQPPSYHIDRLRQLPVGYFVDVMTNGFGAMSSYASQIPPADRWAIAAYVRALQASQYSPVAELPAEDRAALSALPAQP